MIFEKFCFDVYGFFCTTALRMLFNEALELDAINSWFVNEALYFRRGEWLALSKKLFICFDLN